ncbi:hypothetical protein [Candidatus Accumulibacter sp. ACC003]|uniref:hypothetical protein n=1 Tax=Candidatus Accumulibacter sp. ACC003 TaxID=2823334 RepID=UPI0025C67630|nr:hypothetical protein [Candidatus Accumulibacter sp. ACC003]
MATATRAQAAAATDLAAHVQNIASMTEESDAATRSNADAADHLQALAGKLQSAVAYFKV